MARMAIAIFGSKYTTKYPYMHESNQEWLCIGVGLVLVLYYTYTIKYSYTYDSILKASWNSRNMHKCKKYELGYCQR